MRLTQRLGSIWSVAEQSHSLVTTRQLHADGFDRAQIRLLVDDRMLERVIRGLYRLRGSRTPTQDIAAAVSRHAGAVASHRSALYLHGLRARSPRRPDLTLPPVSTGLGRLGIVHRSPLPDADRSSLDGIPVTTVARSIVDSADTLSLEELQSILNDALGRHIVSVDDVQAALQRSEAGPGRLGSARMRTLLAPWVATISPDSPAEAAVIRRVLDFGLPAPTTQYEIHDHDGRVVARVDLAWPERRVIREYDSDQFHGPERIEADELRRQRLEALGWSVGTVCRRDLRPSENRWLKLLARALRHA